MLGKGLESLIPPKSSSEPNQSDENLNNQNQFKPEAFNSNDSSIFQAQNNEAHSFLTPAPASVSAPVPVPTPTPISNPTPITANPISSIPEPIIKKEEIIIDKKEDLPVLKVASDLAYEAEEREIEKKPEAVFQIEVDKIIPNPHQPRRQFNEEDLRDLANSIREFGVIQPLVVTKISEETEHGTEVYYELIAGERRLRASRMVGLRTVPAIVKHVSIEKEKLELAIIENIQRADLNPVEEARAYARLQDEFRMTQREIASRLGKSRETVANAMRLLGLPSEIQSALETGQLNESQARLLLQIDDIAKQKEVFYSILTDRPSVRALKERIKEVAAPKREERVNPTLEAIKNRLEEILGTRVDIKSEGDKGKITINFYSPEELSALIEKLVKPNDNQPL